MTIAQEILNETNSNFMSALILADKHEEKISEEQDYTREISVIKFSDNSALRFKGMTGRIDVL